MVVHPTSPLEVVVSSEAVSHQTAWPLQLEIIAQLQQSCVLDQDICDFCFNLESKVAILKHLDKNSSFLR